MYTRFQLAKKYISYFISASNGKGHGVHSPFVFDFIIHVLNDKKEYPCYSEIENYRKALLKNEKVIEVEDFGAGSTILPYKQKRLKDIASSSLKPRKYAQLLFRIAQYYKSETIVELGTSLGITSMYLASSPVNPEVYTLEGSSAVAQVAGENFQKAQLDNIQLSLGSFEKTLPDLIQKITKADLLFIDGNHRKKATLEYFELFLSRNTNESIFIFDDIHWSKEMEEAWQIIQEHPAVTLSIDLFFIGIVFFNPQFKVKQHFTIRF
ncbi:MAG: class I SAM-dependent methyltransferase [Ginsengibacter sp.]